MSIITKTDAEIDLMREPCAIVRDTLAFVGERISAGMSTKEVDELVERFIRAAGAYPSCLGYGGFPASACVSVNEVVVHGIPDDKTILKDGDIVSVDLCAYKNGFHGDAARTFLIGNVSEEKRLFFTIQTVDLTAKCDTDTGRKEAAASSRSRLHTDSVCGASSVQTHITRPCALHLGDASPNASDSDGSRD